MKKASIGKIAILTTLIWSLVFCAGNAQNPLKIPTLGFGQQTGNWCWAACMDMLFEFHGVNKGVTQCDLAKAYSLFNSGGDLPISSDPCNVLTICGGTCTEMTGCNSYDQTIQINHPEVSYIDEAKPHFFDLIFSFHEYTSTETTARMSWEEVKRQIDRCRPFITLRTDKFTGVTGLHAMLATGYLEQKSPQLEYIYYVNPWNPLNCNAIEEIMPLPQKLFLMPDALPQYQYSVRAFVYDIRPMAIDDCLSCAQLNQLNPNIVKTQFTQESPDLHKLVQENLGKFIGTLGNEFKEDTFQTFFRPNSNHYQSPVKYILPRPVLDSKKWFKPFNFNVITNETPIVDVIYTGTTPHLVSRFHKKDQTWFLEKITLATDAEPISCTVNGKEIYLSNVPFPNNSLQTIPYEKVEMKPLLYQFYRFRYQNQIYMTPVRTYANFFANRQPPNSPTMVEISAQQKIAYQEDAVLRSIRRKIDAYYTKPQPEPPKTDTKATTNNSIKKKQ